MELDVGEKVGLLIERKRNIGFSVLINGSFKGLLYENEIFEPIETGMQIEGYIKKIREDGKYDVSLKPQGFLNVIESNCSLILDKLKITGELKLSDKSNPDEIIQQLQLSKKAFKRAIGVLYKEKKIIIEKSRILLLKKH
ncbi:MAG: DNA-binding protein [Flavobacteriaceae bacterium TMED68]|nr:MAG: DNA-binding protein [Flavobacteriaceae bacterium TMED68]|tara:strand:- start:1203 stop:1622 length:420 start_codon:yes stop_codon:yes gene_type:complete